MKGISIQSTRTKILVLLTGALLLYTLVIVPFVSRWMGLAEDLSQKQRKLILQQQRIAEKSEADKILEPYREELALGETFSEEQVNALFLKEVEGILETAGLKIINVKVLPVLKEDGIHRFRIQIETEGGLDRVTDLFYRTAVDPKLIQIDDFSAERKDSYSDLLNIKVVFSKFKI